MWERWSCEPTIEDAIVSSDPESVRRNPSDQQVVAPGGSVRDVSARYRLAVATAASFSAAGNYARWCRLLERSRHGGFHFGQRPVRVDVEQHVARHELLRFGIDA